MNKNITASGTDARIGELVQHYGALTACAADLLCDKHDPSRIAYQVIHNDIESTAITYGELRRSSEIFASALAGLGVKPGDRVATLMGKSQDYLITILGIWRLGAVHLPLFTAFAPPAIEYRLRDSGAKAIICDQAQAQKLTPDETTLIITTGANPQPGMLSFSTLMSSYTPGREAARLGGDAPLIHIYTSGTTGHPKAVVAPIKMLAACHAYAEFGLGLSSDDTYWCAADPGWAYGLYFGVLATFTTGVPSILFEGNFSPEATFSILSRYRVTNFTAAPTVYRSLRTSGIPIPDGLDIRCASSAGEPLTAEVNGWALTALGTLVHDHYGQTEAGMLINNHHHPKLKTPLKAGSMGQAMPGWKATVLHETNDEPVPENVLGRIAMEVAESPLAWFSGYLNEPKKSMEKFAGNGRWYLTGDTGYMDEQGYFHFSARDDDVIIMAGYRIGPFEVESVIATHPEISECAVIATPDTVRGEVLEAYVVLRNKVASSPSLAQEIQQFVKEKYAAHAYPRTIHFVEQLPKTPSGKIQRFLLRKQRLEEISQQQTSY